MRKDLKLFLWLLKLGAPLNLYFLARTLSPPLASVDPHILIPARILFTVSAFRCLFPVSYQDHTVLHDSPLSSIFLTRLLATFAEIALIYQLARLIQLLNTPQVAWIDLLSWLMVAQVVVSQGFVWGAILARRLILYVCEELGWAFIYAASTAASAYLYTTAASGPGGRTLLLQLNLIFGALYLPWQLIHLRRLLADARHQRSEQGPPAALTWQALARGLRHSIHQRNPRSDAPAWGGLIGVIWMAGYWAAVIPVWVFLIVTRV